jgi:hemolysin III
MRPASRSELWADGIVHALALVVAVAGIALLASHAAARRSGLELSAVIVYGVALIAMLAFSCAYNLAREGKLKPFLRRLDHSGIYLLIAGTYTPLLTQFDDRFAAWALGITVWGGALVGIALKFAAPRRFAEDSSIIYLALSWVALLAYEQITTSLPPTALLLLLLGGVVYTVGVVFHLWERLRYQRAIWHGFVAVAATCHWGAVAACMELV